MQMRFIGYLCVVAIPLLYLALAFAYQPSPATIYTLRDPSYYYLLNTFLLAQGEWSYLYAHPGVSLQLAGAAVVWMRWLLLADKSLPMAEELVRHHIDYFYAVSSAGIVLNSAALAAFGLVLWKRRVPLPVLLLCHALFLAAPLWLVLFNGLFQAEAVAIALGAGFAALLCGQWRSRVSPIFVGTVAATKLNFAVFFVLNLLPPKLSSKARAMALSAFVFGLLMVAVYPTWDRGWLHLTNLFLAKGPYTDGGTGVLSFEELWSALQLQAGEAASVWIALPLTLLLAGLVFHGRGEGECRKRFLLALSAFLLAIVIYLKKPTHASYLYPALVAYPAVVATYFLCTLGTRKFWLGGGLVTLAALWQLSALPLGLWNFRAFERSNLSAQQFLEDAMARNPACYFLLHGTLPLPGDALQMGADWAGDSWFGPLEKAYPRLRWLNPEGKVRHFSFASVPAEDWVSSLPSRECVILVVHPHALPSLSISESQVELLAEIPLTALYRWKRH